MINWLKPYWLGLVKWVLIALAILAAWARGRSEGKTAEKTGNMEKTNETLREVIRQDAVVNAGHDADDWMHDTRMDDAMRRKHHSAATHPKK